MIRPYLAGPIRTWVRGFSNQRFSISISETPNPKSFVYSSSSERIPRSVITQLSQHGAVSDVHQINEKSVAVTFFESQAFIASVREDLRSELHDLITQAHPSTMSVDLPEQEVERKTFDPSTAAWRVEQVIAERIRPGVNADGGDVELVDLTDDGVAIVRMMGSCNGCPSSEATLKNAIERTLLHFCADDVKEVRQAVTETPTIDSSDILGAMSLGSEQLPSVISHHHVGQPIDPPLSASNFAIVSLFARQVDEKLVKRVKFASTVNIPKNSTAGIDVWVNCGDCGAKKRLEDVDRLISDAKERMPDTDRVAVVICPACAVIVKEV